VEKDGDSHKQFLHESVMRVLRNDSKKRKNRGEGEDD